MTREEIAQRIADEGWCPETRVERGQRGGYYVMAEMFVSDTQVDEWIVEHDECSAEQQL